ncbi:MAG: SusE domain-containing protein, partial [Bacteroidales bacterium]
MKKLSIIIFLIGLVGLFSCKKDETKAVIQSPTAPVLNVAGGDTIVLQKANADVLITYTWSAASFGLALVTTYTLQVDKQGNNFKDPIAIGAVTSATSFSILTSDLNNKLLGMEFNPDLNPSTPMALEFRVIATVSTLTSTAYSPVVSKVMTPYYIKIVYPLLFVPGNYQGWNPADSSTVIYSAKSNLKYDGYVWMGSSAP